jgi:hypothetical protein
MDDGQNPKTGVILSIFQPVLRQTDLQQQNIRTDGWISSHLIPLVAECR